MDGVWIWVDVIEGNLQTFYENQIRSPEHFRATSHLALSLFQDNWLDAVLLFCFVFVPS